MGYSYTLVNFWRLILILEGKLSLWDIISKLRDLRGKSGLFREFSWTLKSWPFRSHWVTRVTGMTRIARVVKVTRLTRLTIWHVRRPELPGWPDRLRGANPHQKGHNFFKTSKWGVWIISNPYSSSKFMLQILLVYLYRVLLVKMLIWEVGVFLKVFCAVVKYDDS